MIIDKIENASCYAENNEKFQKGFDFIKKALRENLTTGKYEIDGEAMYASVQEYETFAEEGRVFEGHRKYIDLQFVAKGREKLDVIDITRAKEITPYNDEIEAAFFTPQEKPWSGILSAGDFAILFPHDLHRPGSRAEGIPEKVKKIIVKIAI